MKIDELIQELKQVKEEHGNLDVLTSEVLPERVEVGDGENSVHIAL